LKYIRTGLKFDPRTNQIVQSKPEAPKNKKGLPSEKYYGEVATGYDAKRQSQEKWHVEQRIIERMLSDFPAGSWVLDAPCGTGRFFPCYEEKQFIVRGIDISPDMLAEAGKKISDPGRMVDGEKAYGWCVTNIIENGLPLDDSSVDIVVCCRFTRWVMGQYGPEGIKRLLSELQRVARQAVIITARVENHPVQVPLELIEDCLNVEWAVHENAEGYEPAYRIIKLGPAA
jgi:ubiquinone/menaquinone biosynthesis C-methylase UbiE